MATQQELLQARTALQRARAQAQSAQALRSSDRSGMVQRETQGRQLQQFESNIREQEELLRQREGSLDAGRAGLINEAIRAGLRGKIGSSDAFKNLSRTDREIVRQAVTRIEDSYERQAVDRGISDIQEQLGRSINAQERAGVARAVVTEIRGDSDEARKIIDNLFNRQNQSSGNRTTDIIRNSNIDIQKLLRENAMRNVNSPNPTLREQALQMSIFNNQDRNRRPSIGEFTMLPADSRSTYLRENAELLAARGATAGLTQLARVIPTGTTVASFPISPYPTLYPTRSIDFVTRQPEEGAVSGPQALRFVGRGFRDVALLSNPVTGIPYSGLLASEAGGGLFKTISNSGGVSFVSPEAEAEYRRRRGLSIAGNIFQIGLAGTGFGTGGLAIVKNVKSLTRSGVTAAESIELQNLKFTDPLAYSLKKLEILNREQANLPKKEFMIFQKKFNKAFPTESEIARQERLASNKNFAFYKPLITSTGIQAEAGVGEVIVPKNIVVTLSRDLKKAGFFKTIDDAERFISTSETSASTGTVSFGMLSEIPIVKGSLGEIRKMARLPSVESRPDLFRTSSLRSVQFLGTGPSGMQAVRVQFIPDKQGRATQQMISYIEVPKDSRFGLIRSFRARRSSTQTFTVPSPEGFFNPKIVVRRSRELQQIPEELRFSVNRGTADILDTPKGELIKTDNIFNIRRIRPVGTEPVREEDFISTLYSGLTRAKLRKQFRGGLSLGRGRTREILTVSSPEQRLFGGRVQGRDNTLGFYVGGESQATQRISQTISSTGVPLKRISINVPTAKERIERASRAMRILSEEGPLVQITSRDVRSVPILFKPRTQRMETLPSYVGGEGGIASIGEFAGVRAVIPIRTPQGISFITESNTEQGFSRLPIVRPVEIPITNTRGGLITTERNNQNLGFDLLQENKQDKDVRLSAIQIPKQINIQGQPISQDVRQGQERAQVSSQLLQLQQKLLSPLVLRPVTVQPRRPERRNPNVPRSRNPPRLILPEESALLGGNLVTNMAKLRSAFDVYIKKAGKSVKIAEGLPFGRALQKGVTRNIEDLSASFELIKSGTTKKKDITFTVPKDIFYKGKNGALRFVEKRSKRLDTGSEVKDIAFFKKIRGRK